MKSQTVHDTLGSINVCWKPFISGHRINCRVKIQRYAQIWPRHCGSCLIELIKKVQWSFSKWRTRRGTQNTHIDFIRLTPKQTQAPFYYTPTTILTHLPLHTATNLPVGGIIVKGQLTASALANLVAAFTATLVSPSSVTMKDLSRLLRQHLQQKKASKEEHTLHHDTTTSQHDYHYTLRSTIHISEQVDAECNLRFNSHYSHKDGHSYSNAECPAILNIVLYGGFVRIFRFFR